MKINGSRTIGRRPLREGRQLVEQPVDAACAHISCPVPSNADSRNSLSERQASSPFRQHLLLPLQPRLNLRPQAARARAALVERRAPPVVERADSRLEVYLEPSAQRLLLQIVPAARGGQRGFRVPLVVLTSCARPRPGTGAERRWPRFRLGAVCSRCAESPATP